MRVTTNQPIGEMFGRRKNIRAFRFVSDKPAVFFSFHFSDLVRVYCVRDAWNDRHFVLWPISELESRQFCDAESIKRSIRERVGATSVVCVLIGSEAWQRRWVRYEIACAVIDGKGLLAVHISKIRHPETKTIGRQGPNPLGFLAVGKVRNGNRSAPRYYLFEWTATPVLGGRYRWSWDRYQDHPDPVQLPTWLPDPATGCVTPLSLHTGEHDYCNDGGPENLDEWIETAAQRAGG